MKKTIMAITLMMAFYSHAGIIVNLVEQGSDVVATATGSLDMSAFNPTGSSNPGTVSSYMWLDIGSAMTFGGTGGNDFYTADTLIGPESSMGTGGYLGASTADTGTTIGWYGQSLTIGSDYVSGASIDREMTFSNASFNSLGLNEGSYVWTFTTDGNTETYTVNVPEPATLGLAGVFGAGILFVRRIFMI
ncbi:PEP-CTERM sorting domain-containing protein [Pontiellaceae bacterium B12219]|nr:PEP-CTERM sorting domain-containing protein [Pontiellaceae bacterium B12219]